LRDIFSCIHSVLSICFIYWFGSLSQKDKNNLQSIVNISSKVTGLKLTALYEKHVLRKATKIINENIHILLNDYTFLPSSRRVGTITSKTNRKRVSLIRSNICMIFQRQAPRADVSVRHRHHQSLCVYVVFFYLLKDDHNYNYILV